VTIADRPRRGRHIFVIGWSGGAGKGTALDHRRIELLGEDTEFRGPVRTHGEGAGSGVRVASPTNPKQWRNG
jgi:hypothetical protein